MKPKPINHSGISVQFLGDTAIVIIDKALVEQLAIDNRTYLREEITQDGSIVLRIEPSTGSFFPMIEVLNNQRKCFMLNLS